MGQIVIYTDGCCMKNPGGAGGYAAIICDGDDRREISDGYRSTTNNRMEMMAAIAALESVEDGRLVTVYSDSQYLVRAIEDGWVRKWLRNGWRTRSGDVKNRDLWERLWVCVARCDVKFKWLKGHNGHIENERCDVLAGMAAKHSRQHDHGYSEPNTREAAAVA